MQSWTLVSGDGTIVDALTDPNQRVRPVISPDGSSLTQAGGDGRVAEYPVSSLILKHGGQQKVAELPAAKGVLYVTDQRVVLVFPDIDLGPSAGAGLLDVMTLGAAGTLRELGRSAAGHAGIREKVHLVAQIDYLSLAVVRYYQTKVWGTGSALDLGVVTGEPQPRHMEFFTTRLPRKMDVAAVGNDILGRARAAWNADELAVLDDAGRAAADACRFDAHGAAFMAMMGHPATVDAVYAADRAAAAER